jgi:competence protein ComEA
LTKRAIFPDNNGVLANKNIFILLGLALLILGLVYLLSLSNESAKVEIIPSETAKTQEVVVDLAGAVEKPGVYRLKSDARINDALMLAGGLAADADRDWVAKNLNLAAPLKDGIKIYIKSKKMIKETEEKLDDKLNINTASLAELESLPGIGQVLAQRILDYRQENGPFGEIEELLKVQGISVATFEKFKNQISAW